MAPEGMPLLEEKAEVKKNTLLRRILMKIVEFRALWGEHVLLNPTSWGPPGDLLGPPGASWAPLEAS